MAIKIKGEKLIIKKFGDIARTGLKMPRENLVILGNMMANKIKVRTRLGRDIQENKLPGLSEKYIEQRVRLKENGELYEQTTPKRSNLTKTGQLLNNMYATSKGNNTFTIRFRENRIESKVKNSEIVGYQRKLGRDFFGLSRPEIAFLQKQVIQYFKRVFKL
ncbi:MAG: hypothetical protein ACP5N7_00965 [Candidatus Pacearchaeota archaeon]